MHQEHYRQGNERILWVSVSTDLKFDAARDMEDVGADGIPIAPKVSFLASNVLMRSCV